MYNKVILVGNLTRDIEMRNTPSGTSVGNTGIATSRKFKSADGQQKEEVCFVDITFFGRTAEIANQYLHKGSKILVEGRLKLDTWQDQSGAKRSKHSIVVDSMKMLDSKPHGASSDYHKPQTQQRNQTNLHQHATDTMPYAKQGQSSFPNDGIDGDEIPF